ncbi:MAG: hypothetical protein UT63_C0006G0027 [Candidatus Gottesmanbacteria bacterium GW2011_GWC2_39_8]|uniref:Uncharacterized protein n=1 Tax=Candidatus Gottesmanbacteria bacterium GW2011_GWC2_39_8 TaxID=1618450 RepID=A0A0G0Q180_9BACT|nr:MAG: hypothetical protein UT63_C0006G0027 [Candidatus Gottesmanbacteria bacterium GW2011_GWC2_39_8]
MSVPERERRNLVVGKQILRLRHFGENLRNPDVYKYLASCQLFFSKDDFLKRVSHVPQQMLDRRNQVRDEDIGNFDRFTHTVTSLWESQDAVKQSQAEYILRNLYRVMEARSAGNPFERELKEDREFSNKILYDNDSISNLADALMARETEEGETFEVTPVTVFGPVTGNRITFGKKAMSAEFALPMTPADHVTNPLEKTDFAASYMNLRTKYIQLEKDYAKHRKEDTSKIEVEFADNSLPSRLAAEAAAIQPKEPRELAIACARGLCISPETEQVNTIESNILEFASSGLRPEAIRRLSIPLDGESIPAIEITETEADLGEYKKRRERGELIQSVPREDYVYSNGEMLFKATHR